MKISKHFTLEEITCKCGCGFANIHAGTMHLAEQAREFLGHPVTPTSACRCAHHNALVGGAKNSKHVLGLAIDIPCEDPEALYNYMDSLYPTAMGLGLYKKDGFVHLDFDPGNRRRWSK
jgi:uncharacterized protein YcbK (DUF882 family)